MNISRAAVVLSATLLIAGCGTERSGGVAIVDLDRVASALGRDTAMVQHLQQQQQGLEQQLTAVKNNFQQQLKNEVEKLPEEPTQEQATKLLTMKRNANIQLAGYTQQAQAKLGQLKGKTIADFRAEAMPVAQQVAEERGMSVVLTSNDSVVFAFSDSVDITDAVIAELKKKPTPASPALKETPQAESAPEATTAEAAGTETE